MGFPVDRRCGLVLRFVDFHLLPDLLDAVGRVQKLLTGTPWHRLFDAPEWQIDHIDDAEEESAESLLKDARRLAEGLELVDSTRLTDAGRDIARLAATPLVERTEQHERRLRYVLSRQIMSHYFRPRASLVEMLLEGAARVANSPLVPGLLLIEVQALIELAHRLEGLGWSWVNQIDWVRETALERYEIPDTGVEGWAEVVGAEEAERFTAQVNLADAVTQYYIETDETLDMTMTEVRATAMLLNFAGIFELRQPLGPVQYLALPT